MNYYDELGVSPRASAEEIRRAYRELVRLLHPDQQQEEGLRRAAERQMQRLNAIVAVLTDPAERRRYDAALWAPRRGAGSLQSIVAAARGGWVWLVTAALGGAGLAYYLAAQGGGTAAPPVPRKGVERPVVTQLAGEPAAARAPKMAPPPMQSRPRRQPAEPVREPAAEPQPATEPQPAAAPSALPPPAAARAAPMAAAAGAVAPAAKPEPRAAPALAGTWLYVPPRVPERQELLYPPEYIELRLIEEAGRVYGRYRARYRVADGTLWPEVVFEFEGRSGRESFPWRGAEGARGEVRLKLLGPGRLEVSWWASQLGERLSLASGTAVLVRERE